MTNVETWENYLFRQHRVVGLSFLRSDLHLLDILIKEGNTGILGGRRPVLARIGSILNLAEKDQEDYWNTAREDIEEGLKSLKDEGETNPSFLKDWDADFHVDLKSSSQILLGAFNLAQASLGRVKLLHGNVQNVSYEKIEDDYVKDAILPYWKPNMKKINLQRSQTWGGELELWVVTEIKYASKLIFGESSSFGTNFNVTVPFTGLPVDPSASVSCQLGSNGQVVITAPATRRVPFAYKAIRVRFDNEGVLMAIKPHMGIKTPETRDSDDKSFVLSVDEDPAHNLSGLFHNPSSRSLSDLPDDVDGLISLEINYISPDPELDELEKDEQ